MRDQNKDIVISTPLVITQLEKVQLKRIDYEKERFVGMIGNNFFSTPFFKKFY